MNAITCSRTHMQLLLFSLLWACLSAAPVKAGSAGTEAWFEQDEPDVSGVNEGELELFTSPPPGGPFHHHQNQLTITGDSLRSGWVGLTQCHEHLDPVPLAEIAFRQGHVRNLAITRATGIGKAKVAEHSVQLEDISAQAKLCLSAELKLVTRLENGRHLLRSGPYMRRFLDGFYPMRVSLRILRSGYNGSVELIHPVPSQGLVVAREDDQLHIDALFAGRLLLEFELADHP